MTRGGAIWKLRHPGISVLFFVVISSTMTVSVGIVVSSMSMRIMTMAVTVIVVSRCDSDLEVVPCEISEYTVLDVASEVPLL